MPTDNEKPTTSNNAEPYIYRNENEWMPPQSNHRPVQPKPQVRADPPQKAEPVIEKNRQATATKTGKGASPPVLEITVTPPPEDDSSLGSMGYLFTQRQRQSQRRPESSAKEKPPQQSVPKKEEEAPKVAAESKAERKDNDYYRTWILPATQTTAMNLNRIEESDRGDPPGVPGTRKKPTVTPHETPVVKVEPTALQPPENAIESWTPQRPTYDRTTMKNPDAWQAWMEQYDQKAIMRAKKGKYGSPKGSIGSDWAPPDKRLLSTLEQNDSSSDQSGSKAWGSLLPPSRITRLDFAGTLNSQLASATNKQGKESPRVPDTASRSASKPSSAPAGTPQSRAVLNETAVKAVKANDWVPVMEDISSSSISSDTSSDLSSDSDPDVMKGTRDKKAEIVSSSSSEDTDKIFAAVKTKEQQNSAPPKPANKASNAGDIESATPRRKKAANAGKGNERPWYMKALLILLPLGAVLLILGLVVWLTVGNGSGSGGSDGNTGRPPNFSLRPTQSPAERPSPQAIRELILGASPDTELRLLNSNTAQSRALSWVSGNQFLASYTDEKILQRFVLAVLYYSTSGSSWLRRNQWISNVDECDWYSSGTTGKPCNSQGGLDEIKLKNNGLSGKVEWTELAILASQLTTLDLSGNSISGPITNDVRRLKGLLGFDLHNNQVSGAIPSGLGDLTGLRQLDLSENRLVGGIPEQISSMTSLQSIRLNDNLLSGTIPTVLGRLTNLQQLFLDGNDFVGTMPQEICALQLLRLEVNCDVDCSCCTACGEGSSGGGPGGGGGGGGSNGGEDLSGDPLYELIVANFPEGAAALSNPESPQRAAFLWMKSPFNDQVTSDGRLLQRYAMAVLFYSTVGGRWTTTALWLSGEDECNWFSASPDGGNCNGNGNVVEINLQENGLQGSLPGELALLSNTLEILSLQGNEISGSIPTELAALTRLEQLNLASNDIFGMIPSSISRMTSLKRLLLLDNNLFSTIPPELGFLRNLEFVDVGANQLTGVIPTTLGAIQNLAGLSIYRNFLTGNIPIELGRLPNLQLFYADENDLRGPVPTAFCALDLDEFWSDCEETQCTCCTTCCSDGAGCV